MFFRIHHYFEMISVLAGLALFFSVRRHNFIWLLLLCIVGLTIDLTSIWVFFVKKLPNNYFIVNLYVLLAAPLIYYGFYRHLRMIASNRFWYKVVAIAIYVGFLVDYFILTEKNEVATFSIVFFYFFNVLLSCGVLFKLAMEDGVFRFSDVPIFWVASALLIFSLGALVTLGMHQFIRINQLTIQNMALYRVIMPVLNIILYSLFTYSFILCRLKPKLY